MLVALLLNKLDLLVVSGRRWGIFTRSGRRDRGPLVRYGATNTIPDSRVGVILLLFIVLLAHFSLCGSFLFFSK